jgi:hypothetical protein
MPRFVSQPEHAVAILEQTVLIAALGEAVAHLKMR